MKVTGPYRAEHRRKAITGEWRPNIEDAMADAKLLGTGAAVVSSERVLLARFETATKFVPKDGAHEEGDETLENDAFGTTRRGARKLTRSRGSY